MGFLMRRRLVPPVRIPPLVAALALCAATPATAQQTIAPPGNSGVEQYLETVPTAAGNAAPALGKTRKLPAPVRRQLAQHGNDGRQLSQLVATTSPSRSRHRHAAERPSSPIAVEGHPSLRSAAGALGAGSDSGGMGIVLPVLLLASVAGISAIAVRRRRG
jgi:hypothetical protein